MVVKHACQLYSQVWQFESDVILYGGQTLCAVSLAVCAFESDVILYGGQTFFTLLTI